MPEFCLLLEECSSQAVISLLLEGVDSGGKNKNLGVFIGEKVDEISDRIG